MLFEYYGIKSKWNIISFFPRLIYSYFQRLNYRVNVDVIKRGIESNVRGEVADGNKKFNNNNSK